MIVPIIEIGTRYNALGNGVKIETLTLTVSVNECCDER
jgi:hypothetical protein